MPYIPDEIHGALIQQATDEARYEAQLQDEVLAILKQLQSDLAADIVDANLDTPRTDWQRARLRDLVDSAQSKIEGSYGKINDLTLNELTELVQVTSSGVSLGLNKAIGGDLIQALGWADTQLRALVDGTLIQGAPSAEWWSRQATDLQQAFSDQMQQGILRGETIDQLVQRVKGSSDTTGIMEIATRNAEALVRSSVISTANAAHLATYKQNSDLIKGIQWVSTLDTRTTPICQVLDGMQWDLDGNPIGDALPFPGPTAHWGCRSTQIPIMKSWEELAKEAGGDTKVAAQLDAMDQSTRASMGGQVSGDLTYETWFEQQSAAVQEDILGPGKYEIWKRGNLSFRDMVNQRGNPLTLEQLRDRSK